MKILMITQWFDPEPTFKGLQFARELTAQGHQVRVVTGFPNYPGGSIYEGYRVRPWQRDDIDDIQVLRVPLYPSHNGSPVARVWNYLSFALSASLGVLSGSRPDVAYVYHPPATVALPAIVLKVLRGVPFVYDVQDLWPDTLAATGMVNNPRVLSVVGAAMKRVYASAARVVVLSDGFKERLVALGTPTQKVSVIPNWADESRTDSDDTSHSLPRRPDRPFTIVFAGNLGKAQGLETVLDAAEHLSADHVQIVLLGGGLERETLVKSAENRGLTNVSFIPRVPITEVGGHLQAADALLVHLKEDPLFTITIPSKLQAYLLAGKPVLMGVSGDAAEMLERSGAGIAFPPGDPSAMVAAVRQLAKMDPDLRDAMGKRGAEYYRTELSLAVGAQRFGEAFAAAHRSKPRFEAGKRLLDLVASSALLVLLSAPMVAVDIAVRSTIGRPAVFRQVRPGRHGEEFTMLKFRSMSDERDATGNLLPDSQRLGRLGAFLRRTSLDELPGLINVLKGEMSLVGPRPLLVRYSPYFTASERVRFEVRPGITGMAQVNGRNSASWDTRLGFDAWYVENRSIVLDTRILLKTLSRVFRRSGVHVSPHDMMLDLDEERGASS